MDNFKEFGVLLVLNSLGLSANFLKQNGDASGKIGITLASLVVAKGVGIEPNKHQFSTMYHLDVVIPMLFVLVVIGRVLAFVNLNTQQRVAN